MSSSWNIDHDFVALESAFTKPVQYEAIYKRVVTPSAKLKISYELDQQYWLEVIQAAAIDTRTEIAHKKVSEITTKQNAFHRRKDCVEISERNPTQTAEKTQKKSR